MIDQIQPILIIALIVVTIIDIKISNKIAYIKQKCIKCSGKIARFESIDNDIEHNIETMDNSRITIVEYTVDGEKREARRLGLLKNKNIGDELTIYYDRNENNLIIDNGFNKTKIGLIVIEGLLILLIITSLL